MKVHFLLFIWLTAVEFFPNAFGQSKNLPSNLTFDVQEAATVGSSYVPMDSWIYPALDRLHALGYLDTAFLGVRPWTRLSIAHMLEESADQIQSNTENDEARDIYFAVLDEVQPDVDRVDETGSPHAELESVYSVFRGISGTPLRDSFHLGQSIINDYGRPYESGFNNYSGFSGRGSRPVLTIFSWRISGRSVSGRLFACLGGVPVQHH
jgi:hypothetical protein